MWNLQDTLLYYTPDNNGTYFNRFKNNSVKSIIGFDFDGTLITQKSGKKFATEFDDMKFMYNNITEKIQKLIDDGCVVFIFTNQSGVERKTINVDFLKQRFELFMKNIGLNIPIYISTSKDDWRKPSSKMWVKALKDFSVIAKLNININEVDCLFVGDAAGRLASQNKKKDFSCSDRKFAHNCGIKFKTPEEFFLNSDPITEWSWCSFDPFEYTKNINTNNLLLNNDCLKFIETSKTSKDVFVFILTGAPGSGKSTFCSKYLSWCNVVNMDTLKTKPKCMKLVKESLAKNISVAVDNTNPSSTTRKEYIELAKKCNSNVKIIGLNFDIPRDLCQHLNCMRAAMSNGTRSKVPDVSYHAYYKRFQTPTENEGFNQLFTILPTLQFDESTFNMFFLQFYD